MKILKKITPTEYQNDDKLSAFKGRNLITPNVVYYYLLEHKLIAEISYKAGDWFIGQMWGITIAHIPSKTNCCSVNKPVFNESLIVPYLESLELEDIEELKE